MTHYEMIDDAAMDQVKGGLSFSFDIGLDTGISVESSLGSISVPSPLTVAKDVFTTLGGAIGDLLTTVGNKLTELGHLFDFS